MKTGTHIKNGIIYSGGGGSGSEPNVNQGEHYSTEEQIIGTWIDGKPLYRKTITFTTVASSEFTTLMSITTENIKSIRGMVDGQRAINGYESNNTTIVRTNNAHTEVIHRSESGVGSGKSAFVTIEYTKTTD